MKNVAKCDTWCELQNPANHRVFERKLRPKPLGRGHVCLGVTHRVAPPKCASCARGSGYWPPVPPAGAAGSKRSPRRRTHDKWWFISKLVQPCASPKSVSAHNDPFSAPSLNRTSALRPRPQVRRDYPLSLSISISGGKETYKDSLSNGERTGKCPA